MIIKTFLIETSKDGFRADIIKNNNEFKVVYIKNHNILEEENIDSCNSLFVDNYIENKLKRMSLL